MSLGPENRVFVKGYDEKLAATMPGQANWADPSIGHTCGECYFWRGNEHKRQRRCLKAEQMTGRPSAYVPGYAIACRFFEMKAS